MLEKSVFIVRVKVALEVWDGGLSATLVTKVDDLRE